MFAHERLSSAFDIDFLVPSLKVVEGYGSETPPFGTDCLTAMPLHSTRIRGTDCGEGRRRVQIENVNRDGEVLEETESSGQEPELKVLNVNPIDVHRFGASLERGEPSIPIFF